MNYSMHRREFARLAAAAAAVAVMGERSFANDAAPKLRKAVKFSMVKTDGTVEEKFQLLKSLGFEGVELDSPSDIYRQAARDARQSTGVVIHGVIDSVH